MMGMEAKVLYLNAGRAASLCFDACKVPPTETLTNESMRLYFFFFFFCYLLLLLLLLMMMMMVVVVVFIIVGLLL